MKSPTHWIGGITMTIGGAMLVGWPASLGAIFLMMGWHAFGVTDRSAGDP